MKKTIGTIILLLAFSTSINAESKVTEKEEVPFESCVSIAMELTSDRPDLFLLAYQYCIYNRCGCFN